jgi:formylglycine-generating enzyme required for sulfatase activity
MPASPHKRVVHGPAVPRPKPPSSEPGTPESRGAPARVAGTTLRWEYQWEDAVNAVGEPAVEPPLPVRLVDEINHLAAAGVPSVLLFVRGELGIGKSALAALVKERLPEAAARAADRATGNALATCRVLEAEDLESPIEFATRVKRELASAARVIAIARPETLDVAATWIDRAPDASVVMRPFEPTSALFPECIRTVCDAAELHGERARKRVEVLASQLPTVLQTPFYFQELANVVKLSPPSAGHDDQSPLERFQTSLDLRIGPGAFEELLDCALGRRPPDTIRHIAGIIDGRGFAHDGYRNVVLAVSVLIGHETFLTLTQTANVFPAVQTVLDHVGHAWRRRPLDFNDPLLQQLRSFVIDMTAESEVPYLVYLQGQVAASLRHLGSDEAAQALRTRCLEFINGRPVTRPKSTDDVSHWWDVSDALSAVGDPRLRAAEAGRYGINSGYFIEVPCTTVDIGSRSIPTREDDAKPVLPFARTSVEVGPLWVANFLVTNEQFQDFWFSSSRAEYFEHTGGQWYRQEPDLMAQIEGSFDTIAPRCYWLDIKEQHQVALSTGAMSILDVARARALRSDRIKLWDPTLADQRFSALGNPVVGINWWEAMAFCAWWTDVRLPESDFPDGARATLLTDWEWEAIRRLFYDPDLEDRQVYDEPRYPAHLRRVGRVRGGRRERVTNVMRPLHVGLSPVPHGPGPLDMVGNVWEFTRSRVFAQIVAGDDEEGEKDARYHGTLWDDVNPDAEQTPLHPERDVTTALGDLSYRALRGGSFLSIDLQAAWHPAYRLCDPPFTSYFDLGFRIAVYPPSNGRLP